MRSSSRTRLTVKTDLNDGFYRSDLNPGNAPKLGVVFPTGTGVEPMVAVPLVLPMGWVNSLPAFTQTSASSPPCITPLLINWTRWPQ